MRLLVASLVVLTTAALCLPLGASAAGVRGDYRLNYLVAEYLTAERRDSTYVAGSLRRAESLVQDLRLVVWPGLEGLDVQSHVRGRWGSNAAWPYGDRDPEVVNLYVTFTRERYRLRAGRQTLHGALGVYYLDGLNARYLAAPWLTVQAWGGWSRGRTLNDDRAGALLDQDDVWAPLESSTLWAGEITVRPRRTPVSASVLYLRELRSDRSTLYSERLSVSGYAATGGWYLDALSTVDVAAAEINTLHLGARRPLSASTDIFFRFRHYRPFFELWTIWGAFSPVAYRQVALGADWRRGPWHTSASAAYRTYQDTDAGLETFPVEEEGWNVSGSLGWSRKPWEAGIQGGVRLGPGSYLGSTDLHVRYTVSPAFSVGGLLTANQRINEYRLGDGRTYGGAVEARVDWRSLSLRGQAGYYEQRQKELPGYDDYNQFRSRLLLTYRIGEDPGYSKPKPAGGVNP